MIFLKNASYEATFLPSVGMNLISFKKEGVEIIDQSTKDLFEERSSGLGPLIGPHFHRRNPAIIPPIPNENLFPHIAHIRAKGIKDPFSHGIARYAPWIAASTPTKIHAELSGKETWHGVPLSTLEGQNFKMLFEVELTAKGLKLDLSIVSDTDSLVGIHYYYRLPAGQAQVISRVKEHYLDPAKSGATPQKIPKQWRGNVPNTLNFDLSQSADYTFSPGVDPLHAEILLKTSEYSLTTSYSSISEENSWQLYHPENASFVCMEPISSQDPRHPNLSVSGLSINLSISL